MATTKGSRVWQVRAQDREERWQAGLAASGLSRPSDFMRRALDDLCDVLLDGRAPTAAPRGTSRVDPFELVRR